ncbi:MAG: cupin domain-containing protein [Sphingomonadaceae bacterium]|nr:cupin domain-containing protein [Sphingomonadaceae bacterium]
MSDIAQSQSHDPLRLTLREQFLKIGSLPARILADETALAHLRALSIEDPSIEQANARKALWQVDDCIYRLATSNAITTILDDLLGEPGYYLWGAQLVDRSPGENHGWHTDIETAREGFVSVWIGIDGASEETSVSVINGSHEVSAPLQAFWPSEHAARLDPAAREILLHPELSGVSGPTIATCANGEGIFFDGRIWHGSFNRADRARRALLLQYGKHGTPVRHTASFDAFPFQYHPSDNPLTTPVKGDPDPVANKTVIRQPDGALAYPAAKVCARPELAEEAEKAWEMYPYFRIETPIMKWFSCHASVLGASYMPHTPHEHKDEEVLVLLSGEAAIFAEADSSGALRVNKAIPGDVFYYPPGMQHTISNLSASGASLRYVMLKWAGRSGRTQKVDGFKIPARAHDGEKRLSIDRPSSGLDKLHIHSTTLAPGKGYGRHIDRYDTAILVLSGELSMLDNKLGPGGVFYTRAGELHDTRNTSAAPCHYLVFEFHAMAN